MIWFHEKVLRHRVRRVEMPAQWVHRGQRPKRLLVNCACGKIWVRR